MFGIGMWEIILIAGVLGLMVIPLLVVVIALAIGGIKRREQ